MKMHNPAHPGEVIKELFIEELDISERYLASKLKVSPASLNRLLNKKSNLSPEMALRLSKTLGRSAESWLALQDQYSLWVASKNINLDEVEKLDISA